MAINDHETHEIITIHTRPDQSIKNFIKRELTNSSNETIPPNQINRPIHWRGIYQQDQEAGQGQFGMPGLPPGQGQSIRGSAYFPPVGQQARWINEPTQKYLMQKQMIYRPPLQMQYQPARQPKYPEVWISKILEQQLQIQQETQALQGQSRMPGLQPGQGQFGMPGLQPVQGQSRMIGLPLGQGQFGMPGLQLGQRQSRMIGLQPVQGQSRMPGLQPGQGQFGMIPGQIGVPQIIRIIKRPLVQAKNHSSYRVRR